jgi:hypothetical protein
MTSSEEIVQVKVTPGSILINATGTAGKVLVFGILIIAGVAVWILLSRGKV